MKQWGGFCFFSPHSCVQRGPTSESVQPLPPEKLAPKLLALSVFFKKEEAGEKATFAS